MDRKETNNSCDLSTMPSQGITTAKDKEPKKNSCKTFVCGKMFLSFRLLSFIWEAFFSKVRFELQTLVGEKQRQQQA